MIPTLLQLKETEKKEETKIAVVVLDKFNFMRDCVHKECQQWILFSLLSINSDSQVDF